ncbi:hypothetical protein [Haloactinomyces albus]|uniref:Uncharacterized protein n=1 Tax=Haloactinomyces albus TaxID=1352928 RepID=A0AAE3ZGS9_9ACTN|nr:hypothetical protein [Haloactinomyces albus]MDR7304656.1 hypothetical protein [Haloactinomyces albus]
MWSLTSGEDLAIAVAEGAFDDVVAHVGVDASVGTEVDGGVLLREAGGHLKLCPHPGRQRPWRTNLGFPDWQALVID